MNRVSHTQGNVSSIISKSLVIVTKYTKSRKSGNSGNRSRDADRKGQETERERERKREEWTAGRGTRHRVVYEIDYPRPIRILFAYDNQ